MGAVITTHGTRPLAPAEAVRAQRLAAARLDARSIAAILEVDEARVLRTFRQPVARPQERADEPGFKLTPLEPGSTSFYVDW